jgi:hypothetical protein
MFVEAIHRRANSIIRFLNEMIIIKSFERSVASGNMIWKKFGFNYTNKTKTEINVILFSYLTHLYLRWLIGLERVLPYHGIQPFLYEYGIWGMERPIWIILFHKVMDRITAR